MHLLPLLLLVIFSTNVLGSEPIQPIPRTLSLDQAKVNLGAKLFQDKRLSKANNIACDSCHKENIGLADEKDFSLTAKGGKRKRNTQGLFNVSLLAYLHWDGRFKNLTELSIRGTKGALGVSWDHIVLFLKSDPDYLALFNKIYAEGVTKLTASDALAEYQKSYLTPDSKFDLYLRGDNSAITAQEKNGYDLFKNYGCISCHNGIAMGGQMFAKLGQFGDYFKDRGNIKKTDYGRFNRTKKESDRFRFRVPSLRNIALTSPYFHDASQKTLDDVVQTMAKYQLGRKLSTEDADDIVSFLKTLTGKYKGRQL